MPSAPSPSRLARHRGSRLFVLGLAGLLGCSGGGGGGAASSPARLGSLQPKPGGGYYFEDPHQAGEASRLRLLECAWGRLVDVYGLDARGAVVPAPVLRDFVVAEDVVAQPLDFALETNPITQAERLIVQRELGAEDRGRGTFEELLARATQSLGGVVPRAPDASTHMPFSFVARNAVLMLRFDDLLDDDEESLVELAGWARVLAGYPPTAPIGARVVFDPHHGGIRDERFHSTRVLVDLTVSATEAADAAVPLSLNSLGLPRSDPFTDAANVVLRLPTRADPGSGQFTVLHNLAGHPLDARGSAPFDDASPTQDLVRALRSGNESDPNHGFLLDFSAPRVLGAWPCAVLDAQPLDAENALWRLTLAFTTPCRKAPDVGEILTLGERFLEVSAPAFPPDGAGRVDVTLRSLNARAPTRDELLGFGTFQTVYRAGLEVARGCWLRFAPAPRVYPSTDVSSEAVTTLRFSEPIDPDSAQPFDTLMTLRGGESTPLEATNLVVGRLTPSPDLRELSFTPSAPYPHQGDRPLFTVRIPAAGGVTDLAGNELFEPLPGIEFSIDPDSPSQSHASFVMRFDSPDELEPIGPPDLRGQFTYQFSRGTIRPREPIVASKPVDRSDPIVSIMPPFAPGVATPLSPLGSKLQAVWRYADLGWSIRDENKFNLDVVGLFWSPARTTVASDFYEQFEIRLAHSNKLPDEKRRAPVTGGMKYPASGLWDGPIPFEENLLLDPESPQTIVHPRAFGYRIDPRDLSFATTGTALMPWPMNRGGAPKVTFTWRDTSAIATGGNYGAGVPLDSEVGVPLGLENAAGTYAPPGQVPTVGLPLLMEFRCYPSDSGIGLNPLAIVLASNVSASPNFRAYSTGGFNTLGQRVTKNPDLELAPTGGFNPGSNPPGKPTARTADNSLYLGQMDYVVRVSRVHTIWIDTHSDAARYRDVVLEPPDSARPSGTRILVDFRGAEGFIDAEGRPFAAGGLNAYGNPTQGSVVFHGDPTWKHDIAAIDGSRYLQLRFTFLNNVDAGLVAELSAVGVVYRVD